ncbi:hypothetical protein ACEPAI_2888 [Sanghuangporus weigelae]
MEARQQRPRPFATLRKESSADDNVSLYEQRRDSIVPLVSSPFVPKAGDEGPEVDRAYHPDELKVYAHEVPTSDLLLEIAMTTAFASLTDGTPVLRGSNLTSYLCFFAMVWWVWASQVAYNVRFRQADWVHRFFVFLQLFVFCALAAFTNNFNVFSGLRQDTIDEGLELKFNVDSGDEALVNQVKRIRLRLPTLNARGVSIIMAFSRLVLLAQYANALYHVRRKYPFAWTDRKLPITAFLVHIGSLFFSFLCYMTAALVIGRNPTRADQIAKLILWFLPLIVEVVIHFVAAGVPGRVRYPASAIYERSSTVFIIILGGGLDKITNGFQYIVGNVSISGESIGLIFCGVLIVILLFTLYFGTSDGDKLGSRRALALFFFNYFFLSALIVTLQGIAAMLKVGNLSSALEVAYRFVEICVEKMSEKGLGQQLDASDFDDLFITRLEKAGLSLDPFLEQVNEGINTAFVLGDTNIAQNYVYQADVSIMQTIMDNFNALPDENSFLGVRMDIFLEKNATETNFVNTTEYHWIANEVIASNARPALWFFAAGGMILVTLALMCLFNRWPRDRYEWGQTLSRLFLGWIVIIFTAMDVGASSTILTEDFNIEGSRIWFLASHSWVLPLYAFALLAEQLIELVLLHLAGRSYKLEGLSLFWRKVQYVFPGNNARSESPTGGAANAPETKSADEKGRNDKTDYFGTWTTPSMVTSPPTTGGSVFSIPELTEEESGDDTARLPASGHRRGYARQMSTDYTVNEPLVTNADRNF